MNYAHAVGPIISVGKQTQCLLSFVYMSYNRERLRAAHNFGNHTLLCTYAMHILKKKCFTNILSCAA